MNPGEYAPHAPDLEKLQQWALRHPEAANAITSGQAEVVLRLFEGKVAKRVEYVGTSDGHTQESLRVAIDHIRMTREY